jgi:hypothetical protein
MKLSEEELAGYRDTYVNLFVDITEDEHGELRSLRGPELFPLLQRQARAVNPIATAWGLPPAIVIEQSWTESVVATRENLRNTCRAWQPRGCSVMSMLAFAKWAEFVLASAGACECPSNAPPFPEEERAVEDAVAYLVEAHSDRGDDLFDRIAHARCFRAPCDVLPEVIVASWIVANRPDLIATVQARGSGLVVDTAGLGGHISPAREPGGVLQ